jgi:hypothetical protein
MGRRGEIEKDKEKEKGGNIDIPRRHAAKISARHI